MRRILMFVVIVVFIPFSGHTRDFLPNAKLLGHEGFYYLLWHVYDISLYVDGDFSFEKPFFLTLNYKRKLYGEKIADRSAEEIRKLGFNDEVKLAAWHSQMRNVFPDVKEGSALSGVYKPNGPTVFYFDDAVVGVIKDPDFGKWFFGIWLSKNTSEQRLRKKLLGGL